MSKKNIILISVCYFSLIVFGCATKNNKIKLLDKTPIKNYDKIVYNIQWQSLEIINSTPTSIEKDQDRVKEILNPEFINIAKYQDADCLEITIPSGKAINRQTGYSFEIKGKCIVYNQAKPVKLENLENSKYDKIIHSGHHMDYKRDNIQIEIDNFTFKLFTERVNATIQEQK